LSFDKGTILIEGTFPSPYSVFDPRINRHRALGLDYSNIINFFRKNKIEYEDGVANYITPLQKDQFDTDNVVKLRDYQNEALTKWALNDMKGCIVLPTGAGKTIIALYAILKTNTSTLIIVPTLNLMEQWYNSISTMVKAKDQVGKLGGGYEEIKSVTITTYDSAYLKSSYLGNKFEFVIFDEVHHLGSDKYSLIGEQFISPFRLGLTATIEREDHKHINIYRLVGNIVFKKDFYELSQQKHLARFNLNKITVNMLPHEMVRYNRTLYEYKQLLKESKIYYPIRLEKLIILSATNVNLRKALLLRNEALDIALNSQAKIIELEKILENHLSEKIIIFTVHTKLAYSISNRFLIPVITHKTKNEERNEILERFKKGRYRVIVTTKVLDEGTDVPDANMGIILSGTGSKREFIQRLGRLLRPKKDIENLANLIEIISSDTSEVFTSSRRNKGIRNVQR
ncbi:MAG TPA: DEAD/DEAH box helicase family protein, partial [Candidatus Nitrosocosmicus sp.]|nr:DEAD/DEAH box helicase family protein [Candidatus Nitrosocosmicus sp.]